MFIPPLRIALSGGGMRGVAHIGALEVLNERGYLKTVKEYIGISVGALVSFAICIGCTMSEIRSVAILLDFGLVRSLSPESAFQFLENFGLDSGENLGRLLTAMLRLKGLDPAITFRGLAARGGPRLRVFATDLNSCAPKEYSAATTPDLDVRMCVQASMSIPIYFAPARIDGLTLVDGGVITHLPYVILNEEEQATTLGISFKKSCRVVKEIPDFLTFVGQLYKSVGYFEKEAIKKFPGNIVLIPCGDFPATHFEATAEEKEELLAAGRAGMEAFIDVSGRRPPRRFSVA